MLHFHSSAIFLAVLTTVATSAFAVPTVQTMTPATGATVASLTQVSITFSEPVAGVDPDDLLINGESVGTLTGSGAGPYVFTFTQPPAGTVNVSWDLDHGIAGLAAGSGAFVAPAPWTYTLIDTIAPTVALRTPAGGATVGSLTQVEVLFSEAVTGVNAADLLVNGSAAAAVSGSGLGPYVFTFAQPPAGSVTFDWAAGHGIQDTAPTPNNFGGGAWSVTLSAGGFGNLIINEFLAANGTGLTDENGDQEDWIELYNAGSAAVDLVGWALTNDVNELAKWVFPSRVLAPGAYLVVFASGKDRTPGTGNLHTSFTINESGGYLALVSPESPRVAVSAFDPYPEQRTDYSYGVQTGGGLRFFSPPKPNAANGTSILTAVTPKVSVSVGRGFFKDPFQLVLTCADAGATIRYTTDFTEPTVTNGTTYTGPITISATKNLRAVAFNPAKIPSLPVTHTYVFLDQVLTQPNTPAGFPSNWGPNASFPGGVVPADYEMDTDPLRVDPNNATSAVDPIKQQRLKDGLRELPIVSVTIPIIDMFGTNGLYYSTHVEDKSFPYKKCAVEMLLPNGSTAFSTICGISGHGNASRTPVKNPKHGFQLKFKGDFGDSSLSYKLYPDSPVENFDDIILRPDFNTSWRHWSDSAGNGNGAFQRTRATRARDAFVKNTFRDMGGVASRHRFFHLFINGLYWGTYDFAEQPVDGFGKSYFGGEKADYAIVHEGNAKNGADPVYNSMIGMASITTNALYDQLKSYLDVPEFIDYTLLHFYIGHQDWGNIKNWYAIRRRASATNPTQGKYLYIPWDDECTLLDPNVNRVSNSDVPSGLHTKLLVHPQYKLDFADHVHRHLVAPGGALTTPANIARWQKWQAILDKPIVGESARWGDYRRDVHQYQEPPYVLYTRENQWLAENDRLVNTYFPGRPNTLLTQLRTAGLYPNVAAPEYRQNSTTGAIVGSSRIPAGFLLAINNTGAAGTIYYTTDGNDPHIYYTPTTGATATSIAATAQTYTAPFTINGTTTIKSRILNNGTWSALNEATFAVGLPIIPIAITEIMYDPPNAAHEFVEIQNYGAQAVNLSGCYFEGISFVFPLGTVLGPGSRFVLASNNNPASFAAQYPGVNVGGYFDGGLDNTDERIALKAPDGSTIVSVTYSALAPWPQGPANRSGYSLEIINPGGDPDSPFNWQTSATLKGTPGTPNSAAPPPQVEISEVMAENVAAVSNGGVFSDYVELHNTTGAPVDISGWSLISDTFSFTFPAGASIAANGFAVVWSDNVTAAPGFHTGGSSTLNRAGGAVRLQMAGKTIDGIQFGNQIVDRSIGRVAGQWMLTTASPGAANSAAPVASPMGNVVLNEWLASSADGSPDWLELYNKNASLPVALSGLYFQTNTAFYRFDALAFVAPQGYLQLFADEKSGTNQLDFKLPASGTTVTILDPTNAILDTVSFTAQAAGISQGRLPDGTATIASFPNGGSPGAANYLLNYTGPILNEIVARNTNGDVAPWGTRADWVELYNPGAAAFDLSGMRLGFRHDFDMAWTFPTGSTIAAGGYLTVWCDPARPVSTDPGPDMNSGQSLGDDKGALFLFNSAGQLADTVAWGFQIADMAVGKIGAGWRLLAAPTRGAVNGAVAALGATTNLRINEWFDGGAAPDWFELYNMDSAPVDLSGLYLTDDPSESGVTKFVIAPLNFIGAHGWVRLWGEGAIPAGGNQVNFGLDANGEYLRLSAADLALIDAVSFGTPIVGQSEGRLPDGQNVQSGLPPTPAARNGAPGAPTITTQPASQTIVRNGNPAFRVEASGAQPLSYQWKFNDKDIDGATGDSLMLNGVTTANDGFYTVVVTNSMGSMTSDRALLAVQLFYTDWKALYFNAAEQADDSISGPGADPDHDGLTNIQEYFHNLDPRHPATASDKDGLPQLGIEPATGTPQFLTLTYRRSARALLLNVQHQISATLDPGTWANVVPDVTEQLPADPVTGDSRVRLKFVIPGGQPKRFLRLSLAFAP